METLEADALAKRIINSFRGGPPLADWTEELCRLDAGRAGTAYARLRATLDQAPTIARFLVEYHKLDTVRPGDRTPCGDCDDTGWVEAPERHWGNERSSTQCRPCPHCDEGRKRFGSRVWLERHRPTPPPATDDPVLFDDVITR